MVSHVFEVDLFIVEFIQVIPSIHCELDFFKQPFLQIHLNITYKHMQTLALLDLIS